jgi:serine/threonine-protein kinase
MSPEQGRGEEQIDHRIDVYALGVILYECLTGEVPFRGTNYLGIISDVLNRVPTSPRALRPDLAISPATEHVVLRAMAKDREVRYASMAALSRDLRRVLTGQALEPSARIVVPPAMPARTSRPVLLAVAGIVIAATVALVILFRSGGRGEVASASAAPPVTLAASGATGPARSAPPDVASPTLPQPASAVVVVKVDTTPEGAEILNGERLLGTTPQTIELARSDRPVHLSFRLPHYEMAATDVIPQIDGERINVELRPEKHHVIHRARPSVQKKSPGGVDRLPLTDPPWLHDKKK